MFRKIKKINHWWWLTSDWVAVETEKFDQSWTWLITQPASWISK